MAFDKQSCILYMEYCLWNQQLPKTGRKMLETNQQIQQALPKNKIQNAHKIMTVTTICSISVTARNYINQPSQDLTLWPSVYKAGSVTNCNTLCSHSDAGCSLSSTLGCDTVTTVTASSIPKDYSRTVWWHYDPLKRLWPLARRHAITTQMTRTVSLLTSL